MRRYGFSRRFKSGSDPNEALSILERGLRETNGSVNWDSENGNFELKDPKKGVTASFMFKLRSNITLLSNGPNDYLIKVEIFKKPSNLFWMLFLLCFIVPPIGFILFFYVIVDVKTAHKKLLDSIILQMAPYIAGRESDGDPILTAFEVQQTPSIEDRHEWADDVIHGRWSIFNAIEAGLAIVTVLPVIIIIALLGLLNLSDGDLRTGAGLCCGSFAMLFFISSVFGFLLYWVAKKI